MVDLKIIFKFIDKNWLAKDSPTSSEPANKVAEVAVPTDNQKKHIEDIHSYIFELREEPGQLTPEKVEDFLIYEGIEKKYISTSDIEYILSKKDEKISQKYKKLIELNQCLESNSSYNLYLNIYINESSYLEEKKKEESIKKEKEKEEKKEILSKVSQITKELTEIQRQIKNLYQKPTEGENSENYFSAIKNRKKSPNPKVKKKLIPDDYKKDIVKQVIPTSKTTIETKITNKKQKLYFLFSSPLQNNKDNIFYLEDDSYFKEWLCINKIFNGKKLPELILKPIKENIELPQDTSILHIRVDSILKDKQIFFKFCDSEESCIEYSLKNFFRSLVNYKDLILIIISSDNIDEIKEELGKIKEIKNINKIYIYHPNKYDKIKKMKYEDKLNYENYEIKFIDKFYYCLEKWEIIEDAFKDCYNSVKPKDNKMRTAIFVQGKRYCSINTISVKKSEEKNNNKYLLNYDSIKFNYYPIVGRKREFDQCVIKKAKKMCIYGEIGVGKKSFVKKVGFSLLDRGIVDKIYYLDIYPNEIKQSKRIYKIDMIIDEIYNNYDDGNILLIIYFNDIIKGENLIEIRNEIKRERFQRKKEVTINYLYTFTTEKNVINKSIINEFPDSLELKNFNLQHSNKENKEIYLKKDEENQNLKNENKKIEKEIKEKELEKIRNIIHENEIKELFNHYLINKNDKINNFKIIDDILDFSKQENKNINKINNIKITNIFLILIYINFYYEDFIQNQNNKLKSDENIIKLRKILFEDILVEKINILRKIIDKREENKDIFAYLYIMKYGAGLNFLKLLWDNLWKEKTEYIENNLFGLIVVENNENEVIYKLDNSLRELIREILGDLIDNKIIEILKNYNLIFRKIISKIEYNKISSFNACINNEFWSNKQLKEEDNKNFDGQYIINEEIDSNNIYNIIKNIKKDEKLLPYIEDISITLPTILHNNNNYIYEDLVLKLFEEKFEMKYKEYKKIDNKHKIKYIRKLLIRLGIFKCWASNKFYFLKNSLEKVDIRRKGDINELSDDTKREYSLISIYDHIIKNDNNIEEINKDFISYLNNIEGENEKIYFKIRYKALCARCLNSLEEIESLENTHVNYKDELNLLKNQIILYSSKNKFYFYLRNPLDVSSNDILEINNNFYLTHKLLGILPKNFRIEFKTYKSKSKKIEINDIKNILFLYLDNKKLFEDIIKNYYKNKNKNKIHIKILILGYLDNNIEKDTLNELNKIGIKNIIYISNYDYNLKISSKGGVPLFCILQKLFFHFIHNFISILFSKKNNINIYKAFKEAKGNFNKSLKYIFRNYIQEDLNIPKIEINMDDEDDTFEFEYKEAENGESNNNENINYIDNENDYEDIKRKNESIYYMKNPFAEKKEIQIDYKKIANRKYIKLPGVEFMNEDNLRRFINGGLYEISKFRDLVEFIENGMKNNNNIFYVYGNLISKIGDDICKYFYMEEKFENGVFLVRTINNKEEFDSLMESNTIKKNNSKLIVFNKISEQNKIFNTDLINKINRNNKTIFVICSERQEIKYNEVKFYQFNREDKNESLKDLNEEYKFVQSILNNINIKY